jgi:hypothetical protein
LDKSKAVVETSDKSKSPVLVGLNLHRFFAEAASSAGSTASEIGSGDDGDDAGGAFMPVKIQKSNQ